MARKVRINLALEAPLNKRLGILAKRHGLDVTNAIRYCIARTCNVELEGDGFEPERILQLFQTLIRAEVDRYQTKQPH